MDMFKRYNLQFFAADTGNGGTGADSNTTTTDTTNNNAGKDTPKTYTEEEFQSEVDRRVSQAMQTAARKQEKAIKEAQRLAAMSAEEREKEQFRLDREEFEKQKKEFALMSNKVECVKILTGKGMAAELADFVVAEDAETMNANIKAIEKAFKDSVKSEVEKRLNTSNPKKNLPTDQPLTKETFNKLSMSEQLRIYNDNPELWKQLTK